MENLIHALVSCKEDIESLVFASQKVIIAASFIFLERPSKIFLQFPFGVCVFFSANRIQTFVLSLSRYLEQNYRF